MSATATGKTGAKPQAGDGRDATGRFTPGNPGGPGNPFARKVAALRKALVNFITDEDMKEIALILKEKAKMGNPAAIKLLFQYVLGKPAATADPDRLDVDEWQKVQEQARPPREMSKVMNGVPAQMACDVTRIAWPCAVETNFAAPFRASMQAMDERDAQRAAAAARATKGRPPSKKGENGPRLDSAPMTNGPNGGLPAWRDQAMAEVLAESRMAAPNPKRRRPKKRWKPAARR